MHVYGCAHGSHARIRRALVFVCFIQIQPGLALVEEKHAWKKLNTDRWKNMSRIYPKGQVQNASLKQAPEVHHNTTRAHTSRYPVQTKYYYGSKQQEEAVPIYITTILYLVCTSIILPLLSLYLRRVWMIRSGYMRKHVVHVPMSRNVTNVWMLTWMPNLSL